MKFFGKNELVNEEVLIKNKNEIEKIYKEVVAKDLMLEEILYEAVKARKISAKNLKSYKNFLIWSDKVIASFRKITTKANTKGKYVSKITEKGPLGTINKIEKILPAFIVYRSKINAIMFSAGQIKQLKD